MDTLDSPEEASMIGSIIVAFIFLGVAVFAVFACIFMCRTANNGQSYQQEYLDKNEIRREHFKLHTIPDKKIGKTEENKDFLSGIFEKNHSKTVNEIDRRNNLSSLKLEKFNSVNIPGAKRLRHTKDNPIPLPPKSRHLSSIGSGI